jgi:hypothetical protein
VRKPPFTDTIYVPPDPAEIPSMSTVKEAVQMMDSPGAPTFATKREKREATVLLTRQLWRSGMSKRKR